MADDRYIEILRLHKAWADRFTILSYVIIALLFGGCFLLLDFFPGSSETRTNALILLTVIILATIIWQAVGLGVARIHMIVSGIDFAQRRR
jgi:DMSO reductase anchor subunit